MNDTIRTTRPVEAEPQKIRRLFPAVAAPDAASEGMDLRAILSIIRRRIKAIIGCAAIVMILATVYIFQLTPRYTAWASLMLEQQKLQLLDIKNVLSGGDPGFAAIATQVELIQSPRLGEKVATRLHLENEPEFNWSLPQPVRFDPIGWIQARISSLVDRAINSAEVSAPIPRLPTPADLGPTVAGHI